MILFKKRKNKRWGNTMNFLKNSKKILSLFIVAILALSNFCLIASANENLVFSDVPAENTYISEMVESGIIKGYDNGLFGYNDVCTRAQFVTFLYRAAGSPEAKKKAEFSDIVSGAYYEAALNWAAENFIVTGFEDGTFGVDLKMDRAHALTFLHRFAKICDKGEYEKRANLYPYSDEGDIDLYAREAFAWALADEIINTNSETLAPKEDATRAFCAEVIGKLLNEHHHEDSEYVDNKDGTHSLKCEIDETHSKTEEHLWNGGDLVKKPTDKEDGEVIKTCKICLAQKNEVVKAGTKILTRADLEKAIVDTAWYYYMKGKNVQYDSTILTKIPNYRGGNMRLNPTAAPEYSTDDMTLYSVCSAYVHMAYVNAVDVIPIDGISPAGISTENTWRLSDNQFQGKFDEYMHNAKDTGSHSSQSGNYINEETTEEDVDMAIMRWVDYDKYEAQYASRIPKDIAFSVFSSDSFTDFTDEEIRFVNDGYDGTVHYSYYDKDGNKLDPDLDIKKKVIKTILEDYEKNLRPGDIFVPKGHSVLYIGNNRVLHCNGGKIDVKTGKDKVENYEEGEIGAILSDIPDAYSVFRSYTDTQFTLARPLDKYIDKGYDEDLGNDVASISEIPEITKSRMKFPCMEINRTVDASPYGAVAKNGNLTCKIEISNKTNNPYYEKWAGKEGAVNYENLTVTEKIPENAEYVDGSITNDGKLKDGVITWNIKKVKPGETITLSYKVKAIGEIGDKIINDGGFVDKIPSNSIINVIGNEKLTDAQKAELSKISANGAEGLKELGSDSDFINNIYKNIRKEINIPAIAEITKELFPAQDFIPGNSYSEFYSADFSATKMFIPKEEVKDEYKAIKQMLVNDYWGGYRFFIGEERKWEQGSSYIKDFKTNYLEAGDIIVYLTAKDREQTTMTNEFANVTVMVYDGENLLSAAKTADGTDYQIYNNDAVQGEMLKALMSDKDLFFALRPSQAK